MIGYEYLLSRIPLRMPPLRQPARVRPVTRVERMPELLAVPRHVAPAEGATLLDHVLFALKHESLRLDILHEALRLVPADDLVRALSAQRLGGYLRRAAFVWEKANGCSLELPWSTTGGNYIDFLDPRVYYVGPQWERCRKYRVNFNGLGPYAYCPVVARDPALELRGQAVLDRLRRWADDARHRGVLDRVMNWACLTETRDSYAIENETPAPVKERAFLQAMAQMHEGRPLSEDYLVDLQNLVITNPIRREFAFRHAQNWLQRGGRGALAVRYLPPPPEGLGELMDGLMRMANAREGTAPPLVKAALVGFGFVLLHPFMDGNGRLSRLLVHHSLALQGVLPQVNGSPAILPLSVVAARLCALGRQGCRGFRDAMRRAGPRTVSRRRDGFPAGLRPCLPGDRPGLRSAGSDHQPADPVDQAEQRSPVGTSQGRRGAARAGAAADRAHRGDRRGLLRTCRIRRLGSDGPMTGEDDDPPGWCSCASLDGHRAPHYHCAHTVHQAER